MKRFIVAVGVVGLAGAALSGAACWRLLGGASFDLRACSGPHFSLTEAEEAELLEAMAEIERGEYVSLEELLQSLPKHG